ncbi:MAG: TonB-dependent receptor, partial [Acidobacteria bacterium]|nr:TonB-dependent receptor [Acidobacteriota bacterium]
MNPTGGNMNYNPGIGGGRNGTSEMQIDGMTAIAPDSNVGISSQVYEPPVDSVAEFNVQVNSLAAEYGHFGGGVINLATKSGTNALHGTAYDFVRHSALDANDFFANRAGQDKGDLKRNQWGGTLGGPVVIPHFYNGHDKSFFFVAFEGSNQVNQSVAAGTVPLAPWKAGNFSDLRTASGAPITIYDPLTVRQDPTTPGKYIRTPFQGNVIPADRIDPVARAMTKYWPDPNTMPTNPYSQANNYINAGSALQDTYRMDTRFDQNWTDRWRMFARFSVAWGTNTPANAYGTIGAPGSQTLSSRRNISIDHTYTFSPTLIGDFRYGFARSVTDMVPFSTGMDLTSLGFPQSFADTAAMRGLLFPYISPGNGIAPLGASSSTMKHNVPMVHSLTASMTKITPRHTIKFGGEFREMLLNFAVRAFPSGNFNFSNGWTQQEITTTAANAGFGMASFMLGLPSGGSMSHDPSSAMASSYWAGYIQDDWKLTSRLTLNIGLRYDLDVPRTDRFNQLSYFSIADASPLQGKVPASACPACGDLRGAMHFVSPGNRHQTPTDTNNFGPRFGFAYNFSSKAVLRGGYGIAYAPSALQAAGSAGTAGMAGFSSSSPFYSTFDTMRTVSAYLRNPFPSGFNLPTGSTLGAATDLGMGISDAFFDAYKTAYVQQWNVNLQHSLPGNLMAEIGYIGSHAIGLVDGDGALAYNQLPASDMALGSRLIAQVPNPFYGLITNPTSHRWFSM